jgi:gliding motility-associated lipoprotein GldH
LRANNNYPFNNIFLIVAIERPNGFTKVDTLEYLMANPDGSLLGDGFTDIKESKLFYKEKVRFRGNYKVHLKQAVRENGKVPGVTVLEGITDVGFRIEKID